MVVTNKFSANCTSIFVQSSGKILRCGISKLNSDFNTLLTEGVFAETYACGVNMSLVTNVLKVFEGTSKVAQWIGIRFSMQETWAKSLVREDSICLRATKPTHHN